MLVRNYGLFWERRLVPWGSRGPGNCGSLFGHADRSKVLIDFSAQAGVYVLYEGLDIAIHRVIYVGQVGAGKNGLRNRLNGHRSDDLWNRWHRFSWFGVYAVGAGDKLNNVGKECVGNVPVAIALDQIEGVLRTLLEPPKNKRGANWHDTTEFFQATLSDLEAVGISRLGVEAP